MRRSALHRSLSVITTLAVAGGVLFAVPSSAATPSGITREQVIAAADAARMDPPVGDHPQSATTVAAVRPLVDRMCPANPAIEQEVSVSVGASGPSDAATGVVVLVAIGTPGTVNGARFCTFGAVAAAAPASALSGTATLNFIDSSSHVLSGDVFVTPARSNGVFDILVPGFTGINSLTVVGNVAQTTTSTVTISTPKTAQQKKVAKKKYTKALSSAKKTYKKAVKKASKKTGSKSKKAKAKAKKAYAKKRVSAKIVYQRAIATTHRQNTTPRVEDRPFAISAEVSLL